MTPRGCGGAQFIWQNKNKQRNIFNHVKLLGMTDVCLQGPKQDAQKDAELWAKAENAGTSWRGGGR